MQRIDKFGGCPKCGSKQASIKYNNQSMRSRDPNSTRDMIYTKDWLELTCGTCGWTCKFACLDQPDEEIDNVEPIGLEN